MVQALLNAKPGAWPVQPIDSSRPCKSQTRMVMKPQPTLESGKPDFWRWKDCAWTDGGLGFPESGIADHAPHKVGDKLWVRETFYDGDMTGKIIYKADGKDDCTGVWKPSVHMPREAARLFLEVKEVRVERLWDMTKEEAKKEGIFPDCKGTRWTEVIRCLDCKSVMVCFSRLWNAIDGEGSWASNPWVWVYEFMRVEK